MHPPSGPAASNEKRIVCTCCNDATMYTPSFPVLRNPQYSCTKEASHQLFVDIHNLASVMFGAIKRARFATDTARMPGVG